MNRLTRRRLLQSSLAVTAPWLAAAEKDAGFKVAPFRFDVTPPVGHPLCGGWITPVVDCTDSLEAIGYVLLGAEKPIVVCAVDWTGILNDAHVAWRKALAEAAGTTPERVAVQCVHQHDAPFVCLRGEELAAEQKAGLNLVQKDWFNECLERARTAIQTALPQAVTVTHIAHGEGRVEQVASNRRVSIGPDGKVLKMRGSSCKDPALAALPEGLIDPMLKTVAFYNGTEKVLACHYYATHPMSHYGKGHVSSDFVGLARKQRQKDEPGCTHIYFTGASGNIAAGKYNDGTPEARIQLAERIYKGIVESEKDLKPQRIAKVSWETHDLLPEVNPVFTRETETVSLTAPKNTPANRIRSAMRLGWIERIEKKVPIVLSALHVNEVSLLHLPAESFVEYQLRAQKMQPGRFVATAAYGDGGAWYIPTQDAFPQGGYEVTVANCAPETDDRLTAGVRQLLSRA